MAQAAAARRPETAQIDAPAPPPRKKGRGKLFALAVLVLASAGAAAWWFQFAADSADAPRPVKETPPVFFALESFVVNLVPEFGDQYLQVDITLMAADQKVVDVIKTRMPEVRNRLLLLLSSKRASEVSTTEGKNRLALAIADEINALIAPNVNLPPQPTDAQNTGADVSAPPASPLPIREVLFTSLIIQ